jgi:hypothetical protein
MRKTRAALEDGVSNLPDSAELDPLPEGDEAGADELLAVDCFRGGKHLV